MDYYVEVPQLRAPEVEVMENVESGQDWTWFSKMIVIIKDLSVLSMRLQKLTNTV